MQWYMSAWSALRHVQCGRPAARCAAARLLVVSGSRHSPAAAQRFKSSTNSVWKPPYLLQAWQHALVAAEQGDEKDQDQHEEGAAEEAGGSRTLVVSGRGS